MDFINLWCESRERTEQELFEAAGLYCQIANIVYAASRERVLNRKFEYRFHANHSQVVRDKIKRGLDRKISGCHKYGHDNALEHLHDAIFQLGFTKKPTTKGLCREINMSDYQLLSDFHYFMAQHMFANPFRQDPFELRNAVWDLIQYFLLLDTLENGFEKESLNRVAHQLLSSQSAAFFENGFPLDFFVHDREYSYSHKETAIACFRDYISTAIFTGVNALIEAQNDARESNKLVFSIV